MPGSAAAPQKRECAFAEKKVLIEASKLADRNMDGIKRYVLELLTALSRIEPGARPRVDVMVLDEVFPLDEALARQGEFSSPSNGDSRERSLAEKIGGLVPPILLFPVKWLIPAPAARRFLGKEKSELRMPVIEKSLGSLPVLLLPPVLVRWLRQAMPHGVLQRLWSRGILQPPPRAVDPGGYDLLHHTLPNNWHFIRKNRKPTLVTVHDLCHVVCPQYQTWSNSVTLETGLELSVATGAGLLAVSESTRDQLDSQYQNRAPRLFVAQNGCNTNLFQPVDDPAKQQEVRQRYGIPDGPFLLTLSTLEPRKNLARTIEAFRLMLDRLEDRNITLVVAGPRGWKSRPILRAAQDCDNIHLPGYVASEDLAALYSAARCFVYASHYEGFGLPLLEAMSCGTPVIYGDNSSMPEIAANAGLPVDSRDVQSMAGQMHRMLTEDGLAERLGQLALERSRRFSWDRAAQGTVKAWRSILCGGD